MANRIKLKGTSERSFDIGLGPKQTFDANNLTANRTWVLPDSNGTSGYVLSTDGTGNLSWAAGGSISSQARLQFTAASNGTGQTFTDVAIATFTNNTYANVFVNGVLLQTSEYSISGTTLTVSRYLSTGDNVVIGPTAAGGTPTGAQGTSWTAAGSIAVGDIFTGTVAGPVSPGATYTASTSSNTNFTTWMPATLSIKSPVMGNVIYVGSSYVACGNQGIYTSSDGMNWTAIDTSTSLNLRCIAYGASTYAATGNNGRLHYSSDGITWTYSGTDVGSCQANSIVYANSLFVAVGTSGIWSSADGITWTNRSSQTSFAIAWDGTYFQVLGKNTGLGVAVILRSTNGITWTTSFTSAITELGYQMAVNGSGLRIAVCGSPAPTMGDNGAIITSNDGINWTETSSPNNSNLGAIAFVNNSFVIGGGSQDPISPATNPYDSASILTTQIFQTSDGITLNKRLRTDYFVNNTTSYNYSLAGNVFPTSLNYVNNRLFMSVSSGLYMGIADNMIYVGNTGTTAPAGTYRCLGSVNPDLPTYLWVRLS